jgi:hypothetical protein
MTGTPLGNILLVIITLVGWIILGIPIGILVGKWLRRRQ